MHRYHQPTALAMRDLTASPSERVKEFNFTHKDFERVRAMIRDCAGIALAEGKHEMVYSRLARRLRATGLDSFTDYLDQLERNALQGEWQAFTNALTTNLTSFYREAHHFPMLADHLLSLKQRNKIEVRIIMAIFPLLYSSVINFPVVVNLNNTSFAIFSLITVDCIVISFNRLLLWPSHNHSQKHFLMRQFRSFGLLNLS